jgi:hypothetical protein
VRDGVDGFRIPTWAPAPGAGGRIAHEYEVGAKDYEYFLSRASTTVSLDARALHERLVALVERPELRRALGEAGREHVCAAYDWAVVYARYEALWRELAEIRARSAADPALRLAEAVRAAPTRRDPFECFATYPTRHIGLATRVRAAPGASLAAYEALTAHPFHGFWRAPPELVGRTLAACAGEGCSIAVLAETLGEPTGPVIERVSRLAKLELVTCAPDEGEA